MTSSAGPGPGADASLDKLPEPALLKIVELVKPLAGNLDADLEFFKASAGLAFTCRRLLRVVLRAWAQAAPALGAPAVLSVDTATASLEQLQHAAGALGLDASAGEADLRASINSAVTAATKDVLAKLRSAYGAAKPAAPAAAAPAAVPAAAAPAADGAAAPAPAAAPAAAEPPAGDGRSPEEQRAAQVAQTLEVVGLPDTVALSPQFVAYVQTGTGDLNELVRAARNEHLQANRRNQAQMLLERANLPLTLLSTPPFANYIIHGQGDPSVIIAQLRAQQVPATEPERRQAALAALANAGLPNGHLGSPSFANYIAMGQGDLAQLVQGAAAQQQQMQSEVQRRDAAVQALTQAGLPVAMMNNPAFTSYIQTGTGNLQALVQAAVAAVVAAQSRRDAARAALAAAGLPEALLSSQGLQPYLLTGQGDLNATVSQMAMYMQQLAAAQQQQAAAAAHQHHQQQHMPHMQQVKPRGPAQPKRDRNSDYQDEFEDDEPPPPKKKTMGKNKKCSVCEENMATRRCTHNCCADCCPGCPRHKN